MFTLRNLIEYATRKNATLVVWFDENESITARREHIRGSILNCECISITTPFNNVRIGESDVVNVGLLNDSNPMTAFFITQVIGGYNVGYIIYDGHFYSKGYIKTVGKHGNYTYTLDYLHAKTMSEKTAVKHLDIISSMGVSEE